MMYLVQPTFKTEAQMFIGVVLYNRDMWTIRSHFLAPMTEAASGPTGRKTMELLYGDFL